MIRGETASVFEVEEANCEYLGREKITFGYVFLSRFCQSKLGVMWSYGVVVRTDSPAIVSG